MQPAATKSEAIVAPRNNSNVTNLNRIDAEASRLIEAMVRSAVTIRKAAAQVVVAGVAMTEIRSRDLDAWARFIKPFQIATKGDGGGYREVAAVLFRRFQNPLQGDGHLINRTISRSQISRYGAAIEIAHGWPERGAKLAERIIRSRGVWAISKLPAEKREHGRRIADPDQQSKALTLTLDRPTSPTLVLILPDGTHRTVPAGLASPIIKRILQ
jgi:hypothetical protein